MQAEVGRGEYWGDTKGSGEAWWRGVAALVRRVLVTAGEDEVLVDDVKRLVRVFEGLEESWIVESLVVKGEVHDAPLMDFVSGVGRGPGVGAWAVARWVKEATERQYL